MSGYRQRRLPTRAFTTMGFLSGDLLLPESASLLDFLVRAPPFLSFADLTFEDYGHKLPSFSVQLRAVQVLVPDAGFDRIEPVNETTQRNRAPVMCVLQAGTVEGKVALLPNARPVDAFSQKRSFVALYDARMRLRTPKQPAGGLVEAPSAVVQVEHLIGLTEPQSPS